MNDEDMRIFLAFLFWKVHVNSDIYVLLILLSNDNVWPSGNEDGSISAELETLDAPVASVDFVKGCSQHGLIFGAQPAKVHHSNFRTLLAIRTVVDGVLVVVVNFCDEFGFFESEFVFESFEKPFRKSKDYVFVRVLILLLN